MGCAQSRIDNEESVSRCKDRRNLMKEAVIARNAFAAGHTGYAVALKNTGAALSYYGHGEVLTDSHEDHHHQPSMDPTSQTPQPPLRPPPPPHHHIEQLPPPPPLPNFSPSPVKPITRTMSMPEIPLDRKQQPGRRIDSMAIMEEDEEEEGEEEEEGNVNVEKKNKMDSSKVVGPQNSNKNNVNVRPPPPPPRSDSKNMAWDYFFMLDNMAGGSGLDAENNDNNTNGNEEEEENHVVVDDVEPKTPGKAVEQKKVKVEVEKEKVEIEHSNTTASPVEFRRLGKTSVNLMQVLSEIDDHFLQASESAQEVSKMLEATRLHYHSNFADNRGDWIWIWIGSISFIH